MPEPVAGETQALTVSINAERSASQIHRADREPELIPADDVGP